MNKIKTLWSDRKNQYEYAKWLFYYSKPYLGRIFLLMCINLTYTAITLYMVTLSKKIIDNAMEGAGFVRFIILYILLMVVLEIVSVGGSLISTLINEKFSFGIRKQVYEKIITSKWIDVKKYHTGDLMTRLTTDAGNIADGIVNTLPGMIMLFVELVMVFFTLFYYSKLLAVLGLVVAPVAAVASFVLGRKMKKLQVKVQESEANYRSFIQESLANLLVVKAFSNEEYCSDKLSILRKERFMWVFKKARMSLWTSTVMSVAFQIGYIAAFSYGAFLISRNTITFGTMSVFLALVNRVQSPVMGLAQQISKVVSILASAGRVIKLENIPVEEKKEISIDTNSVGIDIKNMTFGYSDDTVLENVDLNIKPGEFVAVIGESGIGKTTLIRIIMSFMDASGGGVSFYNDKNEKMDSNAGARKFIAYVPQGNTLFSGTIRENILMGNLNATEEDIWEALRLSAGYDFVKGLPEGLDTSIGEKGHGLSEGQAQRIAIARAFVKRASVLILDEATSALDENTENMVIDGLKKLSPRPTCIVVTHRKSILKYCDREIKIEDKHML
ncbi:MAG: ABC transporter ATP-binding protein/permease [Lachnospiraceae bacterium]|nr:ABC transporter ATP-binding protein/permease [Lachnospiraceae bacterium]